MRIPPDATVVGMCADIDVMQAQLREALGSCSNLVVTTRPPSGDWSIMENVRHLLFVEQLHFRQFYPVRWSPLGWNSRTSTEMDAVGTATPKSIGEVLDAWQAIHRSTRRVIKNHEDEAVREAVYRNWRHLRNHKRIIDRMLRKR